VVHSDADPTSAALRLVTRYHRLAHPPPMGE
jgi:hypothetical protein